jgi:hypothetical protein
VSSRGRKSCSPRQRPIGGFLEHTPRGNKMKKAAQKTPSFLVGSNVIDTEARTQRSWETQPSCSR